MTVEKEFLHRLMRLLNLERQEEFRVSEWQKLSQEFVEFVRSSRVAAELMEEEIWHYTADLDIRMKDQLYATQQRDTVMRAIDKIQAPIDNTTSQS